MKYNYKKASELFKKDFDLCVDPWTLTDTEKQEGRRFFLRAVTRQNEDLSDIIDFIENERDCVCVPCPSDKSQVWDFDEMRKYNDLIEEIRNFTN